MGRVEPAARTPRDRGSQPTTRQGRPAGVKGGRQRRDDEHGHAHGLLEVENLHVRGSHDERSGSEPDIRPGCPVASTLAIGSLGSGKPKI